MANCRYISTSFWTDTKVVDDFTPEDRYVYLYCMTNPHTTLCGCFEISIRQISTETGYNPETVIKVIRRLDEVHQVLRYSSTTKELLITNWHKYNWTRSQSIDRPLLDSIRTVKNQSFRAYLANIYNARPTVTEPYVPDDDNCQFEDIDIVEEPVEQADQKRKKPPKHKYGSYKNVLLSDEDLEKLKSEFPDDWESRIERLSEYIASTGKRYKNHLATIRNWARLDKQNQNMSRGTGSQQQDGTRWDNLWKDN